MNIGLLIAMDKEIKSLISKMKLEVLEDLNFKVQFFKYNGLNIYVCETGIGELNSSISTQHLVDKYNIDLIMNFGVCGNLKDEFEDSKFYVIRHVFHYDFDLDEIDHTGVGKYPEFNSLYIPFDLKYNNEIANKLDVLEVNCASGDKFISKKEVQDELIKNFDADICDMESAGIAFTAEKNKIPCVFLKGSSDHASSNEYSIEKVLSVSEGLFNKFIEILNLIAQ